MSASGRVNIGHGSSCDVATAIGIGSSGGSSSSSSDSRNSSWFTDISTVLLQ
jgi:hypothetical protein